MKENSQVSGLLTSIIFEGQRLGVNYVETTQIEGYPGVRCDVYNFIGDSTRDLGVVKIDGGKYTPPQIVQKVAEEQRTTERYVSGDGRLKVVKPDGTVYLYEISRWSKVALSVDVEPGDKMQWFADPFSHLEIWEICEPAYSEGRFLNI
jgi:hypothetical protein